MAKVPIRAIYEEGHLKLLEEVTLAEGQHVKIHIEMMSEDELMRAALGDLVRWADTSDDSDAWVEGEADAIDKAFRGDPPLSQYIIEDRGDA